MFVKKSEISIGKKPTFCQLHIKDVKNYRF